MSFFQDWNCNLGAKSKCILVAYRVGHTLFQRSNQITKLPFYIYLCFYRVVVEWVLGVELNLKTRVGKRLTIYHGVGLVVNPKVVIGNDVKLRNGVVLGNKGEDQSACPIIGDNVDIGANAVVIGGINIGTNVKIGAGTVVTKNISADAVVVSSPIRIFK